MLDVISTAANLTRITRDCAVEESKKVDNINNDNMLQDLS